MGNFLMKMYMMLLLGLLLLVLGGMMVGCIVNGGGIVFVSVCSEMFVIKGVVDNVCKVVVVIVRYNGMVVVGFVEGVVGLML